MYMYIYICRYMYIYIYMYIHFCVYMGVCRKRGLSRPAPRGLCDIPLVTATCYIPPVADLRFSNKPHLSK